MRLLRLLLAGVIAVAVLMAGFFAAAVVVLAGLVGYGMQLVRGMVGGGSPRRPVAANRTRPRPMDDVIEVEATKVPSDANGR